MIAALGMYDMPALQDANDRLWALIRARLGNGPRKLTRSSDLWAIWQSPNLLLAQTCGMPFRTHLHDKVTLVATPDHGLPECPPGHYRSVLVARADAPGTLAADFDGMVFAYNDPLSQSGWAGPMLHFAKHGIAFRDRLETGAHVNSARAVADGLADIAGLDAVTWELLRRHDPVAASLKVIARTRPTPALPYITAQGRDPAPIAAALRAAVADLAPEHRHALHLTGLATLPKAAYMAVPSPPAV